MLIFRRQSGTATRKVLPDLRCIERYRNTVTYATIAHIFVFDFLCAFRED